MERLIKSIDHWLASGEQVALATVVETWGSSPRGLGAKMAVNSNGVMAGSVSGGCVEGAVVQECLQILEDQGNKLIHYGINDEQAWNVGLACGGEIDVFIRPLKIEHYFKIKQGIKNRVSSVFVSVMNGPGKFRGKEFIITEDQIGDINWNGPLSFLNQATYDAFLEKKISRRVYNLDSLEEITKKNEEKTSEIIDIFFDIITQQPTLIIVGGVHIAIPLIEFAKSSGFYTILIDPRRGFANKTRFPEVDRILSDWPQNAFDDIHLDHMTAVAVLSHDPKIDDPALERVLKSSVFYIGALGSKYTQKQRQKRLLKVGFKKEQIGRIHGPIGLNLGSTTPEEIALGIMAEIILEKNKIMTKNDPQLKKM